MTQYVIRLAMPTERESRADVATMAVLAQRVVESVVAGKRGGAPAGAYLMWSDPDANGGDGAEVWTEDPIKARRFKSNAAAMACWNAQSKVRPLRPDGKPNKPMTAYSIVVEPAP